jgi:hypothetical protein
MVKKFKCTVTQTDEYIVELDESKLDEEWMADSRKYFANFDTFEEHAENIAMAMARFGSQFIEGYGYVLINGKKPIFVTQKESLIETGINVKIISQDENVDVVEE